MNQWLPIVIMMNNYFHDVATALLAASALVMVFILRSVSEEKLDQSKLDFIRRIYSSVTRVAVFSLIWILIGGVPRTIFFKRYEWWDAAGKGIVTALVIKHILMFFLVGIGFFLWLKIKKIMSSIEQGNELDK